MRVHLASSVSAPPAELRRWAVRSAVIAKPSATHELAFLAMVNDFETYAAENAAFYATAKQGLRGTCRSYSTKNLEPTSNKVRFLARIGGWWSVADR